jgi:hypothetical protein
MRGGALTFRTGIALADMHVCHTQMKAERNNLPLVSSSQTLNSSARRWPWIAGIAAILMLIGTVTLRRIRSGNPQPAIATRQRTAGPAGHSGSDGYGKERRYESLPERAWFGRAL